MAWDSDCLASVAQSVWPESAATLCAALFLVGRCCAARRVAFGRPYGSVACYSDAGGSRASRHYRIGQALAVLGWLGKRRELASDFFSGVGAKRGIGIRCRAGL